MEAMRAAWSDDRLDALSDKVDERFDAVSQRFDEIDRRFSEVDRRLLEMDKRFHRIETRLDRIDHRFELLGDTLDQRLYSIQRTMLVGVFALSSAFIAGFAGMITLVATQI